MLTPAMGKVRRREKRRENRSCRRHTQRISLHISPCLSPLSSSLGKVTLTAGNARGAFSLSSSFSCLDKSPSPFGPNCGLEHDKGAAVTSTQIDLESSADRISVCTEGDFQTTPHWSECADRFSLGTRPPFSRIYTP